jgi:hypothetical protein
MRIEGIILVLESHSQKNRKLKKYWTGIFLVNLKNNINPLG